MNCLNCGSEIPGGVKFCAKCGAPAAEGNQPQPAARPEAAYSAPQYAQQTQSYAPQGGYAPAPGYSQYSYAPAPELSTPLSVLGYIGLMLLGGVPVVGFIAFIVMAISSKNKNIKNFSLAWIIISLIGIVLSIIFFAAFSSIFYSMADELTSASIYY